jgi:hypothetical protein
MAESENQEFGVGAKFWSTFRGRIVRAITLEDAYTKDAIMKVTNLEEEQFDRAIEGLIKDKLVTENEDNENFWVTKDLYAKCKSYFENLQSELATWVVEWMESERIKWKWATETDHFYLAGKALTEFSEWIIEQARQEILIANPFVKRCHVSNALKSQGEKGVTVKLLTRGIGTKQFERELTKGVLTFNDESIHAKLMVVDRRVGIVSSMNFYAGSSAGECWEAGIVSLNLKVVREIARSIVAKISNSILEET